MRTVSEEDVAAVVTLVEDARQAYAEACVGMQTGDTRDALNDVRWRLHDALYRFDMHATNSMACAGLGGRVIGTMIRRNGE